MKRLLPFFLLLGGLLALVNTTSVHASIVANPVTFTDLTSQGVGFGSTEIGGAFNFDLINNTGQTWTDFHFATGEVGIGASTFGTITASGVDLTNAYVGPGTASFSAVGQIPAGFENVLDVVGLNIPNGAVYTPTALLSGGEFFIIMGNPTVGGGGAPVPEPATIAIFSLGLAGMSWVRRRKLA